jgi:hypothetical protein
VGLGASVFAAIIDFEKKKNWCTGMMIVDLMDHVRKWPYLVPLTANSFGANVATKLGQKQIRKGELTFP